MPISHQPPFSQDCHAFREISEPFAPPTPNQANQLRKPFLWVFSRVSRQRFIVSVNLFLVSRKPFRTACDGKSWAIKNMPQLVRVNFVSLNGAIRAIAIHQ